MLMQIWIRSIYTEAFDFERTATSARLRYVESRVPLRKSRKKKRRSMSIIITMEEHAHHHHHEGSEVDEYRISTFVYYRHPGF